MAIKTIIKDFEGLSIDKVKGARLILKFNSELKKLGFKQVVLGNANINPDTLKEGLTIIFNPNYSVDINYSERNYRRDSYTDLIDYLASLGGYSGANYHYGLNRGCFEEQVTLKIKKDNKTYIIGDYLPTRNVVIIYFFPFIENWGLGQENKYIIQLLDWIKDVVVNYKIKEQDIAVLKEKIFIAKFTKSINSQISNTQNKMDICENDIEMYKPKIAEWYNQITTSKMVLFNLKNMLENIKGSLLEKIEEIKKLKFVTKIELTEEGIILEFEKIFIKVKEKNIEMGEYIITLMPSDIKIENKEPVKYCNSIYHSCHIKGKTICFGGGHTMAYELLGKMELKKLTHFLYLYLKSYNPEDTYLSMNYWIKGKENGGVVPDNAEEEREGETYCNECDNWIDDDDYNSDEDMCEECYNDRDNEDDDEGEE